MVTAAKNQIDAKGCKTLAPALLAQRTALEYLLHLSNNQIDAKGREALARVGAEDGVEIFCLSENQIGAKGGEARLRDSQNVQSIVISLRSMRIYMHASKRKRRAGTLYRQRMQWVK